MMKITRINLYILMVMSLMNIHICGPVWNLALNKSASQSGNERVYTGAEHSVDGIDSTRTSYRECSSTKGLPGFKHKPWWEVDLAEEYFVKGVAISQSDWGTMYKYLTHNFTIEIYGENKTVDDAILCYYQEEQAETRTTKLYMCVKTIKGRYVRITVHGQPGEQEYIIFCEVRVFGSYKSVPNFVKMEGTEIASVPFETRVVSRYTECAMRCHVLPECHIFSVKAMSGVYDCNIYTTIFLVANSTGNPNEDIFIL